MIHTDQIDRAWEQGPVTIRALRSLTRQAFEAVSDSISDVPGRWTLERHEDYEGYLSVLISSEAGTDAPSYLISGQVGRIELAQLQGDQLRTLGRFENMEVATAELVKALKLSVAK